MYYIFFKAFLIFKNINMKRYIILFITFNTYTIKYIFKNLYLTKDLQFFPIDGSNYQRQI